LDFNIKKNTKLAFKMAWKMAFYAEEEVNE